MPEQKKQSAAKVAIITAIIIAIITTLITRAVIAPHSIGDTVKEKIEIINDEGSVSSVKKATYVYLGANSKLYKTADAILPYGTFLDTLDTISIQGESLVALLIDSGAFPYKQEYTAVTSSADPVRYMIKTVSGETLWVEP